MCGIAGLYNYHSSTETSSELRSKKCFRLSRHRGPDESGIYLGENIALGSVSLSIIDIASGQQP